MVLYNVWETWVEDYGRFQKATKHPWTAPVGSFRPNALGLCDLAGNVREWCESLYDGSTKRVTCGSSWHHGPNEEELLSSRREGVFLTAQDDLTGFRIVLADVAIAPSGK
jgi:formylglycine-generating enzyme required for sulfatase activity